MADTSSDSDFDPERKPGWKRLLTGDLPLEHETAAFVLVSVLDIVLTYLLLRSGRFFESNPIAGYFINHWGQNGMIYFKMGMTAFVCVISQIVALKKPGHADFILKIGTIIVGGVVIYSLVLYVRLR